MMNSIKLLKLTEIITNLKINYTDKNLLPTPQNIKIIKSIQSKESYRSKISCPVKLDDFSHSSKCLRCPFNIMSIEDGKTCVINENSKHYYSVDEIIEAMLFLWRIIK